jgi:hypothetical protein
MCTTADELSFIGAPISDEDLMRYLGSDFNPIVVTENTGSEHFSFTDLMSLILSHESLIQSQISSLSLFLPQTIMLDFIPIRDPLHLLKIQDLHTGQIIGPKLLGHKT